MGNSTIGTLILINNHRSIFIVNVIFVVVVVENIEHLTANTRL